MPRSIYSVSGASNDHRAYALKDGSLSLTLLNQPWGTSLVESWNTPELIATDETASLPASEFCSVYVPGLLIATAETCDTVATFNFERLPAIVEGNAQVFLNPLVTVRRIREEKSHVVRIPSGAILMINSANFYASDIPETSSLCWFHDGNFPRFLLANEPFKRRVEACGHSGLSFRHLGVAN